MPGRGILYDDWKDYDKRKAREKHSDSFFNCSEPWEVRYLVSKIRKHHPFPESVIRDAINFCCRESGTPNLRAEFVNCVMKKLSESI